MRILIVFLLALCGAPQFSFAAEGVAVRDTAAAPPGDAELEQLLAPVALYPDSLLAQVLMASTYPLEVVSAARWAKAHPRLRGKELDESLALQAWDPSVKALAASPDVLFMMDEQLDWTTKLGDAFLARPDACMDAVQRLRSRAVREGALSSGKEQGVSVQPGEFPGSQVVVIEPAAPDVVYVPVYDPVLVYGSWPYPAYPPYLCRPPGYRPVGDLLSFGAGLAAGYFLWGKLDWKHRSVYIHTNDYIKQWRTKPSIPWSRYGRYAASSSRGRDSFFWRHNPVHRKSVPYRRPAPDLRERGSAAPDRRRQDAWHNFQNRVRDDRARQSSYTRQWRERPGLAGRRPGDIRQDRDASPGSRNAGSPSLYRDSTRRDFPPGSLFQDSRRSPRFEGRQSGPRDRGSIRPNAGGGHSRDQGGPARSGDGRARGSGRR